MKLLLVGGARPNFMKLAPLLRAIERHNEHVPDKAILPFLVHTGQHYDYEMSRVFFEDLELPEPNAYLSVGSGTHAEQTGKTMIGLEKVMLQEHPDLAVVVGDVNSTLAGALAAVKLHIPVAHVEAGLRSFDRTMPEEINRLLTDTISDYLFTPSPDADENLLKEGIPEHKIHLVGDIMVDSLLYSQKKAERSPILEQLGLTPSGYGVLTLHRPGTVDDVGTLRPILDAMDQVGHDIPILFAIHPRTAANITKFGLDDRLTEVKDGSVGVNGLYRLNPLGYQDFLRLLSCARFVLTDSGGIQKETMVLGIPCITLRTTTEWPITLTQGTNTLVGVNADRIMREAKKALRGNVKRANIPALWDGRTAERIVDIIANEFVLF